MKTISNRQRDKLKFEQYKYWELKSNLELEILNHQKQIQTLKRKIEEQRPYLEGTNYVHSKCGIKAGIYSPEVKAYYCLLCDKSFTDQEIYNPQNL